MDGLYGRFLDAVLDRRWVVVATWLAVGLVAAGLLAPRAASVVKSIGFTAPGSDSQLAADALQKDFSFSSLDTTAVVLRSPSLTADDSEFKIQVALANTWLRSQAGVRQVRDYTSGDPTLVSADRHTTVMLVVLSGDDTEQQAAIPRLRQSLQAITLEHHVTGRAATNYDLKATSEADLRHAELITFPLVLVLLLIAFRSVVAAAIPLVLGAASVVVTMSLVYLIGLRTDLSVFVLNVCTMLGLGLGIDFSMIVVTRFRAELDAGREVRDAVRVTMASAGRSVVYSGLTVLLGMLAMTLLLDLTVIRSISLGVSLVALAAVLGALTLLPALLLLLGHRIEWLSVRRRPKPKSPESGFWYRASRAITRRPWPWVAFSVVVLVVLAAPVRDLALTGSNPQLLPHTSDSVLGSTALDAAFGPNQLAPVEIVVRTGDGGVWTPALLASVDRLTTVLAADPRVERVDSLSTVAAAFNLSPTGLSPRVIAGDPRLEAVVNRLVDARADTTVIDVVSKSGPYSSDQEALVKDLRQRVLPSLAGGWAEAHVGGSAASFIDFRDRLYGEFPGLVLAVLLITFLILMMFFRSILLPLKAVVLNVVSILGTYGGLVLVFEYGWGSRLAGFEPLGRITAVTPALLFVILFSLSTDYEVFVLSRVREFYLATGDNTRAVALGLQRTGAIVTTAAVILIGIFLSFATAEIVTIKEIGIGLSIGILLDTTIVRMILVPATMRLLGRANWWLPSGVNRVLPALTEGGPAASAEF
jgi:putative drug exporter of the RND superfamily